MTNYEINVLKKALLEVEQKELRYFKNIPNENVELSAEFENNIHKLARKRKTFVWQATKTIPRRIAIVFIAAIITLCMMMSISAIRIPIINFFVDIYEEFISIFIDEEEDVKVPDTIQEVYIPSYTIKDYSLISSSTDSKFVETIWLDENNGNIMILTQDIFKSEYQIYLDNQNVDYQPANFKNLNAHFASKNDQYFFIWTKGYYKFELICSTQLEFSEIENLINSMTISNNMN